MSKWQNPFDPRWYFQVYPDRILFCFEENGSGETFTCVLPINEAISLHQRLGLAIRNVLVKQVPGEQSPLLSGREKEEQDL
jgi:hypothetical protein